MSDSTQAVSGNPDWYAAGTTSTVFQAQDLDRNAFLNLLVTQIQNQDPIKPMQDTEFIAQLAQFSALEQMQQVNDRLSYMSQDATGLNSAYLIGRTVTAVDPESGATFTGTVSALTFESGQPRLVVDDKTFDPFWVTRVE